MFSRENQLARTGANCTLQFVADSRDWRAHLEQMKQLRTNIASNLSGTKAHLNKIHNDIGNTLDKIKTRETYLNRQLEPSLTDYRSLQVSLRVSIL